MSSHQPNEAALEQFARLMEVMATLRAPDGCSWDRKQTHESLRPCVLEEAQEVAEAIDSKDPLALCEELGDLAMMVAFHAQIASEAGTFTMTEVLRGIVEKLRRRHPHVFGDDPKGISPEEVIASWGEIKKEEKSHKALLHVRMGELGRAPSALRATQAIQAEAATVGFDFPSFEAAWEKVPEEIQEVREAVDANDQQRLTEELGDLLFSVVNACRLSGIDAEDAMRQANAKFIRRFTAVEQEMLAQGGFQGKSLATMDHIWNKNK